MLNSGYKDIEMDVWSGLYAPAKTSKETVTQVGSWFAMALKVPAVRAKLLAQGFVPVGTCGPDFSVFLRKQYDGYSRIIREAGIKAE